MYLWRSPVNERSFLRFAFCGTVDDHQPKLPLDKRHRSHPVDVVRAAPGATRATALADGRALPRRLPAGLAAAAGIGCQPGTRRRHARGRRRQPVGANRSVSRPAYNPRRAIQLRKNRRRHVRRRGLRRFRVAAEACRLRCAGPVHEQLGGRRLLLHRRAGFPGRARRGRRARHSVASRELRRAVPRARVRLLPDRVPRGPHAESRCPLQS